MKIYKKKKWKIKLGLLLREEIKMKNSNKFGFLEEGC